MNIINFFTFLVIVIGAAALFIVLSAFAGLKTFSLQFTNTFDPDLKAIPHSGKFFSLSDQKINALENLPGVASFSKEIEERIYLSFKDKNCIAYIKGIDQQYNQVTQVDSSLFFGSWRLPQEEVVIGMGIFNVLGGPLGNRSPLNAITLKPGERSITADAIGSSSFYNQMPMVVGGVYAVEDDLDKKYVFAPLATTQAFLEKDNTQFSGINFKLAPDSNIETVKNNIAAVLGKNIAVLSRQELNGTLHKMLKTEHTATYLIFTLVLVIALFNVVGAIIMLILDKREHSKTLYAMGATIKDLRRIYFIQGVMVTLVGGLIGVLIGVLIIGAQLAFEWYMITPSLAYPVAFEAKNMGIVLATIVVLGLVSSKIASSRISKRLLG